MDITRTIAIEGYSKEEYPVLTSQLEKAVSEHHSWIVDFKKYSKTQASFTIETDLSALENLLADIARLDIALYPENYLFEIRELRAHIRQKEADIQLIFTIHFIQNQKDFRKEFE